VTTGVKEWRQLDWLPDYEISEDGFVRRATASRTRSLGHMPKGSLNPGGYRCFKLMRRLKTNTACASSCVRGMGRSPRRSSLGRQPNQQSL
jgi:hypothetical protein